MKYKSIAAIIALLLLAFTASYGVYTFQSLFVPWWVALASAASFEATYIGIALAPITVQNKRRAMYISIAAVIVSIAYNSISALFTLNPLLLEQRTLWVDIALSLLHGLPLALVAYLVADLIIHRPATGAKQAKPEASVANIEANTKADDFACKQCDYVGTSKKALNGHMIKHKRKR